MLYRNVKTGAVINTLSVLKGDWVPLQVPSQPEQAVKKTPANKKKK